MKINKFAWPAFSLAISSVYLLACGNSAEVDGETATAPPPSGACTLDQLAAGMCGEDSNPVAPPVPGVPPGQGPGTLVMDEGTGGAGGPAQTCIEVVTGFEPLVPTVLLVIDRSSSMNATFDMGRDRWETVRDALVDPTNGMIKKLEKQVRFGLSLYTSVADETDSTMFKGECPLLVDTPIAIDNFDAIAASYNDTPLIVGENGHTPTSESLKAATDTLNAYTEPGPKAIILATDGDPDNCMDADANQAVDPDGMALSKSMSVNAVKAAFDGGIKTYVIGVGDGIAEDHLKELATTGQGSPDAAPYSALSTVELEAAFTDIASDVRTCTFTLQGMVPQSHAMNGTVSLGGMILAFGGENGWVLAADGKSVEVQGSACDAVKGTDLPVNISFPCIPSIPK